MLINCGVYTALIVINLSPGFELTATEFDNAIKTFLEIKGMAYN